MYSDPKELRDSLLTGLSIGFSFMIIGCTICLFGGVPVGVPLLVGGGLICVLNSIPLCLKWRRE